MPINPYQLEFLEDTDILENVKDGYSGAILYKIIRNHKKYFLKIINEKFSKQTILRLQEILKIYKTLAIDSLTIIDYGKIKNCDKYYIIYNFIDGINARCFYNNKEFSLKEIREFGKIIGKDSLSLKNF